MALALFDRVQETTTTTGTGSVTLAGAVPGFQSFAVVGNGNTCYYTIVDGSAWEVGTGTYSTSGPTLARTTILSNSNGNTSPITLAAGTKSVFLTYPAGKSVNLNESGNVSPLGTVSSGVWQGSTVGVAYGGTGVTASSGANSVVLRDGNQNIAVNRVNQANTNTTAAGGTTALTTASSYIHSLVGTGGQTYTLPDATTLTTGVAFVFNNLATGTLTLANFAGTTIGTIPSGGAGAVFLTLNSTTGGTWDLHAYLPEGVTFGTNAFNLGTSIISGGTWQGGTIQTGYGGTGLTSYTSGGAVYANSSSTLTSGTLPVTAGGTGNTTGNSATTSQTNFSNLTIGGSQVLYAGNYNSYAPTLTGGGASGTWGINISGNAATATTATSAPNYLPLAGGTMTGALLVSATVTAPSNATPTALSYGRLQGYGDIHINADTDGSTTEFVYITAGYGTAGSTAANGLAVGYSALTWKNNVILHAGNFNSYAPTLTGTGATGTWNINISGNAATATSATDNTKLPLAGGTMTGDILFANSGLTKRGIMGTVGDNDFWFVGGGATASNTGFMEIATGDDGQTAGTFEPIYASQYGPGNPLTGTLVRRASLLDNNGNTTFPVAVFAPVYYDSNDTAYYGDFASTTWGVFSAGGGRFRNIQISDSTYQDTIQHVTSGANLWLQYSNNGPVGLCYGGGNVGVGTLNSAVAKLHVRASTPGSLGGLPSGVTMISDSSTNNYLLFRNTADNGTYGGIAFQDNNIGGYVVFGNAGGAGDLLYVAGYGGGQLQQGFSDSINPGARTTIASWNSTGLQVNSGDMRAPIYYDSNDTNRYLDPASTSVLNAANWHGVQNWVGDGAYARGTPTYGFRFNNSADTINAFIVNNSGDTTSYSSSRAPIFYDSNNTGYYVNPNSTSNTGGFYLECNAATGRGSYGKALANLVLNATEASGAGYACIDFRSGGNYPSDGAQIYYESSSSGSGELSRLWLRVENDATDEIYLRAGRIFYDSNTVDGGSQNPGHVFRYAGSDRMYVYSDNTTEVSSFRAPIFYDSNNTGFYVDPNGLSSLSSISVGAINSRGVSDLMYYQGFTLDANTMSANATGFTYAVNAPAVGPVARFSTGGGYDLWLNAAYGGSGPNLFFRTRNGDAGSFNAWRTIPSYGVNANIDSLFATIYYDGNNTAYYADFASTAADCARFAGGIHVSVGNVTGQGIILADDGDIVDLNDGYCAMRFSSGVRIHSGNRSGGAVILLSSGGSITASNNITAYGSASDRRLKENIQPLTGALDKVMQLQGCTFDWKEDSEQHTMVGLREDIGFIADAVQDVVPTMVREGKDGYLSLRDRGFSALLVEAMKEQQAQIAALRAEVNALRAH